MPDIDGEQLAAIQEHLKGDLSIEWIWYDFSCMPQQDFAKYLQTGGAETRTHEERAEFNLMLNAVTDLYLTSRVLILLDGSYDSRFWVASLASILNLCRCTAESPEFDSLQRQTLTESWCAMQQVTAEGLRTATVAEHRYTIKCIHNAIDRNAQSLVDLLSKRSPQEVRRILAKPDVQVTNTKDKTQMLPIIQSIDAHVKAIMRELDGECVAWVA